MGMTLYRLRIDLVLAILTLDSISVKLKTVNDSADETEAKLNITLTIKSATIRYPVH